MKEKIGWTLAIAALLIGGGIIYYFINLSLYETTEGLYEVPVPKNAKLVMENEHGKNYEWSRASEENGIPYGYELALKANGWKKGEREGASVFYTKGQQKIDVISTTKHLDILRVN
ncbi:hypothetical protein UP17_11955 [Peribacillus simplex]|uniref:hypothetical protein n=1 Tax=Peribacillus simplex TaxID=1478 RepID=UPI0007778D38|nr:hypothetical protein [Peribacillus simplex]AMM93140.1 hypothetical protein UP17_11955 [Peribacillus simplex]